MNEREALKLALKTLEQIQEGCSNVIADKLHSDAVDLAKLVRKDCNKPIDAIREALAQPEQEPVAIKRMKEWIEYLKRKSDFGQHMKIPSEMNAGTCWELALELEQFINTTPPQREWVGLTDEEVSKLIDIEIGFNSCCGWEEEYTRAVEAKLREKNT